MRFCTSTAEFAQLLSKRLAQAKKHLHRAGQLTIISAVRMALATHFASLAQLVRALP